MIRWPWGKPTDTRREPPGVASRPPVGGDRRAAFDCLAREHAPALYGAARRMTRNPDDAHDLTQDVLVRAYEAFDSFTPGTNFRAWLLRILTNCYITLCRRRQRVTFLPWDEWTDMNDEGPKAVRGAALDEPETALLTNALDGEIEAALARLSPAVRLTLLLVDVEELSYEEAAAALEVPVGTVRSRLNRGREQMRAMLAEYARERRLV
jgi:RNA polymerase sigma-70 factor, ECF subfamily